MLMWPLRKFFLKNNTLKRDVEIIANEHIFSEIFLTRIARTLPKYMQKLFIFVLFSIKKIILFIFY